MEKEIETRFLEINKESLISKLISLGALDKGEEKLEQIIFKSKLWDHKGKFIRLRKTHGKFKLTYKEQIDLTIDGAREIEFEVSDWNKCILFLEKSGITAIRNIEKYRHTLVINNVYFDIDTWPKIPAYVEVEGPSIEAIKEACSLVGLNWENKFDGTPWEVFMHYGLNLDKISVITFTEFKEI